MVAFGIALLWGCGGSSSNGQLNLESFSAGVADTVCSALVSCSCTDASALDDCKTAYGEEFLLMFSETVTVLPGVKLDPTAAATCLADLKTAVSTCPSDLYLGGFSVPRVGATAAGLRKGSAPASCSESALLVGVQTEGERCGSSMECAAGLGCDSRTYTCGPLIASGASCQYVDCQEGLYCGSGELCAQTPGAGQPCPDRVCQDGLTCLPVSDAYTCVAPHDIDASCTDGAGCVSGAYCDSTCKALLADGVACTSGSQCVNHWCNSFDSKCANPGFCSSFERY